MRKLFLILALYPCALVAQDTKRLQPGKMYESGEVILAPRFGFTGTIPVGWSGLLPRESEVFFLTSSTSAAEVFVFGKEQGDLPAMKKSWENGFELDKGIRLQSKSATIQNGTLSGEAVTVGEHIDKSKRAYAFARCGETGACVIVLAVMPAAEFDATKNMVDAFMSAARLQPPSLTSIHADFDWRKFLTGKRMLIYSQMDGGSRKTQVELCADGSFSATVSKKGLMKDLNPQYKGNLMGTWTAEGVGETGTLTLAFKKDLPTITTSLEIKDEQIYANGERYFVAVSEKCK